MQWDDIIINGKGVAVALISNQQLLTDNNIFDNTSKKPLKEGYVDLVGVHGNDSMESEKAFAFEGYATDSQSKTESGYDIFQKAVTKIANTYNPAFIMETGDLVDTNYFEDEWRWFIGKSQGMFGSTAYIPVVGNHEQTSSYDAWAFREHFSVPNECTEEGVTPGTVYSFDYGKVHFVVLNSECKGEGLKAQAKWAADDMSKTKQKYIIAAIHRGPYGGAGIAGDVSEAFTHVFDKYNVELVLFGHDHSYIRTKTLKNGVEDKNGTVYLECGGCASKQDSANSTIPGYAEITGTPGMPVYDVITVTDESIKVKTVTVDESTDTISDLQDTGSINYVNPDAKIEFEVLPKNHSIKENESTTEPATKENESATEPATKIEVINTTANAETTNNETLKTTDIIKEKVPAKVKDLKVKQVKKRSIKISWTKSKNAKKYEVSISTNKKLKKSKTTTYMTSKKVYVLKKLKSRKYYIRVRAINGKKTGKWSNILIKIVK